MCLCNVASAMLDKIDLWVIRDAHDTTRLGDETSTST